MAGIEEKQMPHAKEEEEEILSLRDLTSALEKSPDGKRLEIVNFSAKRLSLIGESYCSVLAKLKVTIRRDDKLDNLHLMMKTMNSVDVFLDWPIVFKKEVLVYTELMPMYKSLEEESGIEDTIEFVPKYYGHQDSRDESSEVVDKHSFLLLEDMSFCGYYTCDRFSGLNYEHAKKALSILSRYHALGLALKAKRPADFLLITNKLETTGFNIEQLKAIYRSLYKTFQEHPRLKKYLPKVSPCFEHRQPKASPWIGLSHGDFRLNNLLFHKDSRGDVDDLKLVDFQLCSQDNMLKDLMFFWMVSLDDETLLDRLDDLLDFYYESLTSRLGRLGCDLEPFSRDEFESELKELALGEFPPCAGACKFVMHRVETEMRNSSEMLNAVMRSECSEAYVDKLLMILDVYERKGWF